MQQGEEQKEEENNEEIKGDKEDQNKEKKEKKEKQEEKPQLREIKDQQPFINDLIYNNGNLIDNVQKLKEFEIQELPIFKAYQDYLLSIFDEKQKDIIIQNIPSVLKAFIDIQMPNKVITVYLVFLENKQLIPKDDQIKKQILELKEALNHKHYSDVIKIFSLQSLFTQEEYQKKLESILEDCKKSQNYDPAFCFIQLFGINQKDVKYLIQTLLDNKGKASKAADYLLKAKINKEEFPHLHTTLQRGYVNYLIRTFEWYKVEDLLLDNKYLLIFAIQMMIKKKQIAEAYSIFIRNNLIQVIKNQEILKQFEACKNQNMNIMPNLLYTNDDFVPIQDVLESTPGKYLAFCDYGINEEDIIFADNNNLDLAINDIMQCTKTGLDSEFGGKNTKLDDEAKLLAVLQISTQKKVYLFDCIKLENNEKMKKFVEDYVTSEILIIGHTIEEDVWRMINHFKVDNKIKTVGVIDVRTIYQKKYKDKPYGLASVCQEVLDQCSQWCRRPLRRAQMHYAAMDAFSCIKIYEKLE